MMSEVKGQSVDPARFKPFEPHEVLYDFEGPKTFAFFDAEREFCLAIWFDEDRERVRYFVVPFSVALLAKLKDGQITVREALDQPRLWLVDVDNRMVPTAAIRTELSALPEDELPVLGTMLYASLETPFRLRATGEAIPSNGIRTTIEMVRQR